MPTIPLETTADPATGTAAPASSDDVAKRLSDLEASLKTSLETNEKLQTAQERLDASNKRLQRERDVARERLTNRPQSTTAPVVRGSPSAELEEFANNKAREALLLRELMHAGLKEEDLPEDLEYTTPAELKATIQIALLNKKIAVQDQQLEALVDVQKKLKEDADRSTSSRSPGGEDTGGPTGLAPAKKISPPEDLRKRAAELKLKGDPKSLQEARWLTLQASYRDQKKIIGRGHGGPTEEG